MLFPAWSAAIMQIPPGTGGVLSDSVHTAGVVEPACPEIALALVQAPMESGVTVLPDIVHTVGVVDLYVTDKPEVAVALTVPVPPKARLGAVPKLMVWLAFATVMFCFTRGAAL